MNKYEEALRENDAYSTISMRAELDLRVNLDALTVYYSNEIVRASKVEIIRGVLKDKVNTLLKTDSEFAEFYGKLREQYTRASEMK